jgi:hypothetical protein
MASSSKKKVRQYSADYLKMGFIQAPHDARIPLCLLCNQTFTNEAMKLGRLKSHFEAKHVEKKDKPLAYFMHLKEQFEKRLTVTSLFKKKENALEKGLLASYKISHLIAKTGKPHTIGEDLIKPAISVQVSCLI